jgi:hypothetical protein
MKKKINGTFLCMLFMYISFYRFNAIIFGDIEILNFEILKNLEVVRSLVPMFQIHFPIFD